MAESNASQLDDIDHAVIRALRSNPRAPNKSLAESIGVSEMTVARRLRRLVEERFVRVTVQRDMRPIGFHTIGLVAIYVQEKPAQEIGAEIAKIAEAYSVSYMVGSPQIVAMMMAHDSSHLLEIVSSKIATIPGVARVDSDIVLRMVNHRTGIAAL